MSKLQTVKNLDNTASQREQIKTVMELQQMIESVSSQLQSSNDLMCAQIQQSVQLLDRTLVEKFALSDLSFDQLRSTMESWRTSVLETQMKSQQQTLDLSELIVSISPTLIQMREQQLQMKNQQMDQNTRLTQIESLLELIRSTLPSLKKNKDGQQYQPKLASSLELAALPEKVWQEKPSMFKRP